MNYRIYPPSNTRIQFHKFSERLCIEIPVERSKYFLIAVSILLICFIPLIIIAGQLGWLMESIFIVLFIGILVLSLQSVSESFYLNSENFKISKYLFNRMIFQRKGKTGEIEAVFYRAHSVINRGVTNIVSGRVTTFRLVAIQTTSETYMFGGRLTEEEVNWLVQEIQDWLRFTSG